MLTVGKLKKWLDERNIPDDAFVFLGYKKENIVFSQDFLERSFDFDESKGNRGILIRSYEEKKEELERKSYKFTEEEKQQINEVLRKRGLR